MVFSRRTSVSSSTSLVQGTKVNASEASPVRRNSSIKSAWTDIKELAREHHRAVNGAFESLYGINGYGYGPNGERFGSISQTTQAVKKA